MASYTPNYNFYLPALGDGALNGKPWGARINGNFSAIDTTLHTFQTSITALEGSIGAGGVPAYSTANNGQFLTVSSGALMWATVPYVNHASGHLAGGGDALSWGTVHGRGTTASKPAASSSNSGYLYFDTSLQKLQRSNGTTWEDCEGTGGGSAADSYSTTEVATNKTWTNGKTIYRKVFTYSWTSGSSWSITHGISGLTEVTEMTGTYYRDSQARWLSLPTASTGNSFTIQVDGTYIYFYSDTDGYVSGTVTIILEYTK